MKPFEAMAFIRQVGCLGLDSRQSIPVMVRALHDVIPSRNNFFYWTKPDGSPVNIYAEEIIPQVFEDFSKSARLLREPTEPSIKTLSTLPTGIGRMHELFAPGLIERSHTREIVLEPYEVSGFSLLTSVRRGSKVLGMVTLGRSRGQKDFTDADCHALKALTPFFLQALAGEAPNDETLWIDSGDGAGIVADGEGRILHIGAAALNLLTYFRHSSLHPEVCLNPLGDFLPEPLRKLCLDLVVISRGGHAPPPTVEIRGGWGRYRARAYPLGARLPTQTDEGCEPIAIFLQQQKPLPLHMAERLRDLPLSGRQREVALHLGLGHTPGEIEADLGITRHTYRDHVAAIYERLHINSRAALLTTLLADRDGEMGMGTAH